MEGGGRYRVRLGRLEEQQEGYLSSSSSSSRGPLSSQESPISSTPTFPPSRTLTDLTVWPLL